MSLYSYISRLVGTTPGTGNMAFRQNTSLPFHSIRGAGRPVANQFMAFAPQIIQTQTLVKQGMGGLFAGQFVSQPLSEPDNNS